MSLYACVCIYTNLFYYFFCAIFFVFNLIYIYIFLLLFHVWFARRLVSVVLLKILFDFQCFISRIFTFALGPLCHRIRLVLSCFIFLANFDEATNEKRGNKQCSHQIHTITHQIFFNIGSE